MAIFEIITYSVYENEYMETKHLSIMFTDMKGFTERTATQSRQQLQHLLELQDNLIKPAISLFRGEIVKTIGDAFMVSFNSPTDAVLCGMKIQENVINHNALAPADDRMEVRIAINSGEVNVKDDDVFGEPVNIAARIEAIAEPNEVYFTEAVYLSMNKNEIPTAEVGRRKLKGVPEEIKIYKVLSEQTSLIRTRLQRAEQAAATGQLSKTGEDTIPAPEQPSAPEQPELQTKKEKKPNIFKRFFGWFNRHKKKFIIAFVILFIIGLLSDIKERERQVEQAASNLEAQSQLIELSNQYAQSFVQNDAKGINAFLDELEKLSETDLADAIKREIRNFITQQLAENARLTRDQKAQMRQIMENLNRDRAENTRAEE